MKKDLEKLFVKSKKVYSRIKTPRKKEFLDECTFLSMRSNHVSYIKNKIWDCKQIGTNLNLLKRFLKKNVGRDWDDVYSDLNSLINKNSFNGNHLYSWICYCVEKHCLLDVYKNVYNCEGSKLGYFGDFYVDPISDKLSYIKTEKNKPKNKIKINLVAIDKDYYYNENEIWFKVKMKEFDKNSFSVSDDCFVTYSPLTFNEFIKYANKNYGLSPEGKTWLCCEKKSASKQQIKKVKNAINIAE